MIVVAGEALIDVVVSPDGATEEAVGGSPLNVAVGLGRLDVAATLITQVGSDDRGSRIVEHVTASGAEIIAPPADDGRTSVATARLDGAGLASYEFDLAWTLPRQQLPPCDALHVGSLGTVLEPGRESVLDLVRQAVAREVVTTYDANLRETFLGDRETALAQVRELGALCTLVKLSDEDAELLDPSTSPDDLARSLLAGERTRLVLLTRGAQGATAFTPDVEVTESPREIEVVDTVGAGDAFMAATLAQLSDLDAYAGHDALPLDEKSLARLVRGAIEVAATTCERRGANPPGRADLPEGWPS
jgi:fructokinase